MTLITNYFDKEKIIIASDSRRMRQKNDKGIKLYCFENFVIGINGIINNEYLINNTPYATRYLSIIVDFMGHIKIQEPSILIEKIRKELYLAVGERRNVHEKSIASLRKQEYNKLKFDLNITISGFYENQLFSFYYQFENDLLTNCLEVDKSNIRFNEQNKIEKPCFSKSDDFIKEWFLQQNLTYYTISSLKELNEVQIIEALKFMYDRYDKSRVCQNIGGPMSYCIIRKTGTIEPHINPKEIKSH